MELKVFNLPRGITKTLLIMKLTAIIVLTACLTASAKGFTQITLSEKNVPLEKVFSEIRKQTGLYFFYDIELLKDAKPVTIIVRNATIDETLTQCLKNQPLTYTIIDKTIVIKVKLGENPNEPTTDEPTNIDVKGKVVNEKGEAAEGVTVTVKGSNKATATDANGEFNLKDVDENATLVFTGVNVETFEVKLNGKTELAITLKTKITALESVVVSKGYYDVKQKLNTGSVTIIKAEDIQKNPVSNPLSALQGRAPGLYIKQNFGAPGTTFDVRIRGQNSIANSNDPLFVVDGVPFISNTLTSFAPGAGFISPLNSLNPDDIESIEVLKDADATSIYGSRGANGVILITTKKGKGTGTALDVNVYSGAGKVTSKYDLMNTEQYLAMRREALSNDGRTVGTTDYDLNGKWDTSRYTDWQKIFIGGTARITNAQMSFSGGNGKTQFTLGGAYRKETTVFPGNYFDKKISVHYGLTHSSSNNKFQLSLLASYLNNNNQLPNFDLTSYIRLAPDAPALYDQFGSLNWQGNTFNNPFALLQQRAKSITNNLITNAVLSYRIFDGFSIKASMGYNNIAMKQNMLFPLSSYSPAAQQPSNRQNLIGANSVQSLIIEPQLNYDKKLGKHELDIIIGSTYNQSLQESLRQTASNFSNDNLIENIRAASSLVVNGYTYAQYRYNAIYGRFGYTYKDRYIINLTGRRDGSSRFGPGKQFGNFGAIGAAWIFSDEKFLKNNIKFLSFGKIRGSYGITGNDQLVPYQYLSTYSSFSYAYMGLNGLVPTRLTNPDYRWEEMKQLELALDLSFLDNRITTNLAWYRKRTNNQLVGYSLPSTAGFTSVQYNLPAVIENSGWEFELNLVPIRNKDFSWSANANLSIPKTKLVSYPNIAGSSYSQQYAVGQSLSVLYSFIYSGIDPNTGLYTFKDINSDGQIDYGIDQNFFFLGLKYHGGFQNTISYKQWELSFLFQFAKKSGRSSYSFSNAGGYAGGNGNQPISALRRWQKPGDKNALIQKYTTLYDTPQEYYEGSNARIEDASFIRLKNLSLSWKAPKSLLQDMHLKQLRLYVEGQNLLTITNYSGIDPETGSGTVLPPIKMFVAGIQLGF